MAAEMATSRRSGVELAILLTISGNLGKALTYDRAMSGLQILEGGQFAGGQILGKILYDRCIIAQEIADCRGRLARGSLDVGPLRLLANDQCRVEQAACNPMGQAFGRNLCASSVETFLAFLPITNAISPSKSDLDRIAGLIPIKLLGVGTALGIDPQGAGASVKRTGHRGSIR
jgi:hypothetical protein